MSRTGNYLKADLSVCALLLDSYRYLALQNSWFIGGMQNLRTLIGTSTLERSSGHYLTVAIKKVNSFNSSNFLIATRFGGVEKTQDALLLPSIVDLSSKI
ncbi:hypothetical protein CDL15_Pgr025814 [Punica granatum]|uniref:Uncharacterized protein n=1 Tax=Punica granatum TaxID=22663 RepID=A0A218WAZ8_PUNGR|nr:hypothetical protein CDL15_Pgr025814 [Punica granatum]